MRSCFTNHYKKHGFAPPERHFVLGSGLSLCIDSALRSPEVSKFWSEAPGLSFKEISGLKTPTAPTHTGLYRYFVHKPTQKTVCFQAGRLHGYEGRSAGETAQTVMGPFLAGAKNFILTNIAGGLKEDIPVGSVVAFSDHVNFLGQNPLTGENPADASGKPLGPRFPDMGGAYDQDMTQAITQFLEKNRLSVFKGVYIGFPGPNLETPAETALFAKWGMAAVGMSTIFEVLALKHAGAKVCAFSLIANKASHLQKGRPLTAKGMMHIVSSKAPAMLKSFFQFAHAKALR